MYWLPIERYKLCLDRTNWKYSKKNVTYLVVSIAWQGASVPIAWICLDKMGENSNTQERIALMQRVLELISANIIDYLLADREFIGKEWFQWLQENHCAHKNIKLSLD